MPQTLYFIFDLIFNLFFQVLKHKRKKLKHKFQFSWLPENGKP